MRLRRWGSLVGWSAVTVTHLKRLCQTLSNQGEPDAADALAVPLACSLSLENGIKAFGQHRNLRGDTGYARTRDVLLVEGDSRISVAIRYLTQSTWSHAALFLGPEAGLPVAEDGEPHVLIEADLEAGIRSIPLSFYRHVHTRICRPVGLESSDLQVMTDYVHSRLGNQYDLKNVVDLARYLLSTPPVPARYRRQLLAFGSGDPTPAICSTFLAQTFQQVRYPILPVRVQLPADDPDCERCEREYFRIRHHSLFCAQGF